MTTPVIFDTDPGVDDAMALLYLNALPHVSIKGITTVYGNASIEDCHRNALFLCERFNIDTPVHQGAGMNRANYPRERYPDFVHGTNGMGDITIPTPTLQTDPRSAAQAIADAVNKYGSDLVIIAVGRLTNLAAAIDIDRGITTTCKEIIIMGGAYRSQGNVSPYAEANIFGDPEAAQFVFEQDIPLTMVGLDVTMQTVMDNNYIESLRTSLGDTGQFIHDITRVYAGYHKESQDWDHFPVHDSSAIAYFDQPEFFETESGRLHCVLDGEERGRTVFTPGDGPHKVCSAVNSKAMLIRYHGVLSARYS